MATKYIISHLIKCSMEKGIYNRWFTGMHKAIDKEFNKTKQELENWCSDIGVCLSYTCNHEKDDLLLGTNDVNIAIKLIVAGFNYSGVCMGDLKCFYIKDQSNYQALFKEFDLYVEAQRFLQEFKEIIEDFDTQDYSEQNHYNPIEEENMVYFNRLTNGDIELDKESADVLIDLAHGEDKEWIKRTIC